ncbi:MAG TPA: redoxin domain-containing protein [Planctomycetota bacterium]|nr:redoxin domain-containing protein [Planctomycetota bacterium]
MTRGLFVLGLAGWLAGCQSSAVPPDPSRAEVLLFVTTDCPLANRYAPELGRIIDRYASLGFRFILVYVDSRTTLAEARRHAREYGLAAEVVVDPVHERADRLGIDVTPEAALLLPDGTLAYRGRIDDRAIELGRIRPEPTRRDLREALDAVASGRPVPNPRTPAVGCFIPRTP